MTKIESKREKLVLTDLAGIFTGRMQGPGYIIIHKGRVKKVGRGQPTVSHDHFKISLEGRYALPMFIDAHRHVLPGFYNKRRMPQVLMNWDKQMRMHFKNMVLNEGICAIADMGSFPERTKKYKKNIKKEKYIGPYIWTALNGLSIKDGYPPQAPELNGLAKKMVGGTFPSRAKHLYNAIEKVEELSSQADFIKIFNQGIRALYDIDGNPDKKEIPRFSYPELAILQESAEQNDMETACHSQYINEFTDAAMAGINHLQHLPLDGILSNDCIDALLQNNQTVTPTLSVTFDRQKRQNKDLYNMIKGYHDNPNTWLLKETTKHLLPKLENSELLTSDEFDNGTIQRYEYVAGINKVVQNFYKLLDFSVKMPMGSDGNGTEHGFGPAFIREIKAYYDLGVPVDAILRMASEDNARYVGRGDIGKISPKNYAHIFTTRENPMENINTLDDICDVYYKNHLIKYNSKET